ncbi:hypothetical protein MK489_06045 [Myxococcota bacterium]|nr:hypothetical protein [Myxococcota bacterium]
MPGRLVNTLGIAGRAPHPVALHFGDEGFRDDLPRDGTDVVLIGDSMVVSEFLSDEAMLSTRITADLGLPTVSLAVNGYGPQQELDVLLNDGLPLAPDVVVWFFFEGDDLIDTRRFQKFHEAPDRNGFVGLHFGERSLVANSLAALAWATTPQRETDSDLAHRRSCDIRLAGSTESRRIYFRFDAQPLKHRSALLQAKRAIKTAQLRSELSGARFLLVYVPAKFRVYAERCAYGPESDLVHWRPDDLPERMLHWSQAAGIEFIDLTRGLQRALIKGESPYLEDDPGLSPVGQARIAQGLLPELQALQSDGRPLLDISSPIIDWEP